ncbi:GDSL-type esterase/lipase family protein [Porticoccaceae bacterium]|nr:GDSL-type esterase/lipase family protein [Porticoccaceae bacterium]MDB4077769.1 GDSL-type esterase/lipase family protein [Porticoccaceae bacterium]
MKHAVLKTLLLMMIAASLSCAQVPEKASPPVIDPQRFQHDIGQFNFRDKTFPPESGGIVFVGSSSFNLWNDRLDEDFEPLDVIARGFGGSTITDVLYYSDRIITAYEPRAVVLYVGGNDISFYDVSPEQVRNSYLQLFSKLQKTNPAIRMYVLSLKPSILEDKVLPLQQETNRLFEEMCNANDQMTYIDVATSMFDSHGELNTSLFTDDQLHMNKQGYDLWKNIIKSVLMKNENKKNTPPLRFGVISDMPYNKTEEMLINAVINPAIDKSNFPFVVHLGDYKSQGTNCTPENDALFKQWVSERTPPVFYTPGDNEWADCDYPPLEKPVSELERLKVIRKEYFSNQIDSNQLSIRQQKGQPENQSWTIKHNGSTVVFGSLHVIGSKNGRYGIHQDNPTDVISQVEQRDKYNSLWLNKIFRRAKEENASAVVIAQHGDPSQKAEENRHCTADHNDLNCNPYLNLNDKLAESTQQFGGPVLLIHGDTGPVCLETAFNKTPNLWRFNSAGDFALLDAVVVEVTPSAGKPFSFTSLVRGLVPGECQN